MSIGAAPTGQTTHNEAISTTLVRQISELVVTLGLLAIALFLITNTTGQDTLVGSIITGVMVYWVGRGVQTQTTSSLQQTTQRALDGPLTAVQTTQDGLTARLMELSQHVNDLKVVQAYGNLAQRRTGETAPPPEVVTAEGEADAVDRRKKA